MSRVIAVVSGKGGVGKTSLVINLGTIISQYFKKRVTIVDCNITTAHIGMYLGMYYHPVTLNKVLRDEAMIHEAVYKHFSGMHIVPASLSVNELKSVDITKMKEKINSLMTTNDIIILDSPPCLGREALACLNASQEVIYITAPYAPFIMDVVRTQEIVKTFDLKEIGLVLNMVEGKKHELSDIEIERLTNLPIVLKIPFDHNFKKSIHNKIPLVVMKPRSKASRAIYKFAANLLGEPYKETVYERFMSKLKKVIGKSY